MPTEHDNDNYDKDISTTTIQGTKSAGNTAPFKTFIPVKPTDHPDRPTKPAKPTPTQSKLITSETTAQPSSTSGPSWLPSSFPTLGVSAKTQIWIYGAAALVLVFCSALSTYLYMARRNRLLTNPRNEWELGLLQEDEDSDTEGKKK